MKQLITLLLLLVGVTLSAQEYTPDLVGKAIFSQTGGGAGYWQVSGTFTDESGAYDGSTIQINDVLYFTDGGNGFFLPITQVTSLTPPSFVVRVSNVGVALISGVPTTIGAIYHPSTNLNLPYYVSGISNPDQQTLINYLVYKIDSLAGVPEITDYIGTYDVSPAVPASSNTGETWRNSVGELYYSDGTSWYTDKEIRYATSSLQGVSSGKYKIGVDTVGTDTIYIANNGTFRRFSTSSTTNLDEAYNNFGSNPAIVNVDGSQGQGDLRITASNMASILFDNTGTGTIEIRNNASPKILVTSSGLIGLNSITTNSGVEIGSSLAQALVSVSSPTWTVGNAVTYLLTSTSSQSITLPSPSSCPSRVYTLVNPANIDKTLSSYESLSGATSTTLPSNSSLTLQSNGFQWVATSFTSSATVSTTDGITIDFSLSGLDITAEVKTNSLDSTHVKLRGLALNDISPSGATTGQIVKFDGTNWIVGDDGGTTYYAGTGIYISNDTIYNTIVTFSGDVAGAYNNLQIQPNTVGATELQSTGVSAGTYPVTANHVPIFVLDVDGRITSISESPITGLIHTIGNPSTTPDPQAASISNDTLYLHYADDVTPGILVASGDVSPGGATAQSGLQVDGLKGRVISNNVPSDGDCYVWDLGQNKWVPGPCGSGEQTTVSDGSTIDFTLTGQDITGEVKINSIDSTHIKVGGIELEGLSRDGATTGQVLKWDGSTWAPSTDLNTGTTYTAGSGIDITGTVISNTGDLSNTNEIQSLSLTGQSLGITSGTGVTLPVVGITSGTGISVSSSSGVVTVTNTGDTNATDDITGTLANKQIAYGSAANTITGSNNLVYDSATGNMGIGAGLTPSSRLHIEGGDLFVFGGANRRFLIGSSISNWGGGRWSDINTYDMVHSTYGGASPILSITSNGFAGVRNNTPTHPLTIYSENSSDNGKYQSWEYLPAPTSYSLQLKQTVTSGNVRYNFSQTNATVNYPDALVFDRGNICAGCTDAAARFHVQGSGATSGTYTAQFHNSTGTNNAFVVRDDGKIGVGTNAPTAKLHIIGNYEQKTPSGTVGTYRVNEPAADQVRGTWDYYVNANIVPDFFGKFGFKFEGGTNNAAKQFQIHLSDATTPKMVINGLGNVGIGTINPAARLHAVGSGTTSGTYTAQFHNSTGTSNSFVVRDDGKIGFGTTSANAKINIEFEGGTNTSTKAVEFTNNGGWSNRWIKTYQTSNARRGLSFGGQGIGVDNDDVLLVNSYPAGRVAINKPNTSAAINYSFEVASGSDTDGIVVSRSGDETNLAMFHTNSEGDGILRTKSGFWTLGDIDVNVPTQNPAAILHLFGPSGATDDAMFTIEKNGGYGGTEFVQSYNSGNISMKIRRKSATLVAPWITTWSDNAASMFRVGVNNETPLAALHVKINGASNIDAVTKSEHTNTDQSGTYNGVHGVITTGSSSNNVTTAYGVTGEVVMNNTANTNNAHAGVRGILTAGNAGNYYATNYAAGYFETTQTSGTSANTTGIASIRAHLAQTAGTSTNLYNLRLTSNLSSANTVTNYYGIDITSDAGAGVITNSYGLRIRPLRGTNKYGLYIDSDNAYIGGTATVSNTTSTTGTKIAMFSSGNTLVEGTLGSGLSIVSGALTATGGTTDLTFSGAASPVTLNSSSGTDVTFTAGAGVSLSATSTDITINNSLKMREESFTATGGQTAFTIAYSAPAVSGTSVPLRVYRNGVRLFWVASGPTSTQFTYSGTTVTTSSNTAGDIITIEYLN